MIESRNLYRIQSGLTKGDKTIPIKTIEKDYVLSWILKGLKNFDIIEMLDRKENNYNKLWDARLANHMINLPYFNKVYRELKKYLKPLNKLIMA